MDQLDLAQSFLESCERAAPIEDLAAAFQQAVERMGFRYFACCSHTNPVRPARYGVMLHNYPEKWVRTFADLNLHEIDPVFLQAERTVLPFSWDAPEFRVGLTAPQEEILAEASAFGLAHGYTIPIHLPWAPGVLRASCSLVPDSSRIHPRSYHTAHLMAVYLLGTAVLRTDVYETTVPPSVLSPRERQCLEFAAQGKSDWVTGRLLGISERTVHNHIERAKQRLGVATRVQAIVQALAGRQISFGDALRRDPAERGGLRGKRRD